MNSIFSLPNKFRAIIIGVFSQYSIMVLGLVIGLVFTPLLLKYLDAEAYGINVLVIHVVQYVLMMDFGFGVAVNREIALNQITPGEQNNYVEQVISTGFFTLGLLGVVTFIVGYLFSLFFNQIFSINEINKDPAFWLVVSSVILVSLQFPLKIFQSLFFINHQQGIANLMRGAPGLISLPLSFVFIAHGWGLYGFLIANIITAIISILITVILFTKYFGFLKIRLSSFSVKIMKSLFGYGFYIFLTNVSAIIVYQTDRMLVGMLITVAAVTGFSLTLRIPEIGFRMINQIARNISPAMFAIARKDKKLVPEKMKMVLSMNFTLAVIFSAIVLAFSEWFIRLWVGQTYFVGNSILWIYVIFSLNFVVVNVNIFYIHIVGDVKPLSVLAGVEATGNLVFSIILGTLFGLEGIVLGSLLAALLVFWYFPKKIVKEVKTTILEMYITPIAKPILVTSFIGTIMVYLMTLLKVAYLESWLVFLLSVSIFTLVLLAFNWWISIDIGLKSYLLEKKQGMLNNILKA